MESYGLAFSQELVVEKVLLVPTWTESDQGRIIYSLRNKRCYIGRLNDWEILGIYEYMIKDHHLFTDDQITGSKHAISALRVPIEFSSDTVSITNPIATQYDSDKEFFGFDSTSNVQFVLDGIHHNLNNTQFKFSDESLTIDMFSDSVTAMAFGVQQDINKLASATTADWNLVDIIIDDPNANFGHVLGLSPTSLQDALVDLAKYLETISASNIPATLSSSPESIMIQFAFDEIQSKQYDLHFTDIEDGPQMYDENELSLLHTTSNAPMDWIEPGSFNINVRLPNVHNSIVEMDTIVVSSEKYFPKGECLTTSIQNTVVFDRITNSPADYYSTGLQQGLEIIRDLQCAPPDRALECSPMLIVASQEEFDTTTRVEQRKDDSLCCPLTKNDNDEDWGLIFSTWHRFSHEKGYNYQPAITSHLGSYALTADGIKTTADSHSHNGTVSFNAYDCFEFEVTITSDTTDNDMIGIVAAFHVDSSGWEHTLTAVRIHGSEEDYMAIGGDGSEANPGTHVQWALVYNYRQDTEWLILDGTGGTAKCPSSYQGDPWSEETGWFNHFSRIKVTRKLDSLSVSCTNWDTEEPFRATLSINLDSDPRLAKFKGPQRYGYSAHSTMNATWERQVIDCLDCGSTNCRDMVLSHEGGCIHTSDPSEIAGLKATLGDTDSTCWPCSRLETVGENLIDFEEVWSTWLRYASPGESTDTWTFINGSIHSTDNWQYVSYFYSSQRYSKYRFELTVRSGNSDDDGIFLVAAHSSNSNLIVMRTQGGLGSSIGSFSVIYNYGLSGMVVLGKMSYNDSSGSWSGRFSRLSVCRYDDILTIMCSNFNSTSLNPNTMVTVDLKDYPLLSGPKSIGFGCISQADSWFSDPGLYAVESPPPPEPIPHIYDYHEQTLWVWADCAWSPVELEYPCGGYIDEPSPCSLVKQSCSALDTTVRKIYDIANLYMYEWDPEECIWVAEHCPDWSELNRNTIFYNDITCRVFYHDCDRQWSPLV